MDCIYEGDRKLYIQPNECIDCGACEATCPVEAIAYGDDVPDDELDHARDNVRFFELVLPGRSAPLGAPGGSLKVGKIGVDTPLVACAPGVADGSPL